MKKIFLLTAIFSSLTVCAFSQEDFLQQVIPSRIFIGDTAEIRLTFDSSVDFFENDPENDEKSLSLEKLPYESDNDEFTVSKMVLQKNGSSYTVVFTLTPWVTGNITLPEFNLVSVATMTSSAPFKISPRPFEVRSVLSDEREEQFFPPIGPLLLPGTIYFVWLFIIVFLIFLLILIFLFVRRKKIMDFLKIKRLLLFYAKNAKRTLKELKKLEEKDKKISDIEFSSIFQKILRKYLQERLGYRFLTVSTKEFSMAFQNATGGFLSEERMEVAEEIEGAFRRTDYIRYAQGSLDSQKFPSSEFAAVFQEGERKRILESARSLVNAFEDEKLSAPKKNGGGKDA